MIVVNNINQKSSDKQKKVQIHESNVVASQSVENWTKDLFPCRTFHFLELIAFTKYTQFPVKTSPCSLMVECLSP